MKILIRIVLVIFITNRIDCLGSICDDCCDCLKGKNIDKCLGMNNEKYVSLNEKDKNEKIEYEEIEEN